MIGRRTLARSALEGVAAFSSAESVYLGSIFIAAPPVMAIKSGLAVRASELHMVDVAVGANMVVS